jgi:hypothetical protein
MQRAPGTDLATVWPKDHGMQPGELVENKRLWAALDFIKERQRERTATGSSAETRP